MKLFVAVQLYMPASTNSTSVIERLPFCRTLCLVSFIGTEFMDHDIVAGGILGGPLQSSTPTPPWKAPVSTGSNSNVFSRPIRRA